MVKNKSAAAYLDHLVGNLMPVEHAAHLDDHDRALSRDGWLKDPPRRVLLQPAKELTLGEEGLRRLREIRQRELDGIRENLKIARREQNDWRTWVDRAEQMRLVDPAIPNVTNALLRLPEAEKERATLDETIRLLSTPEREHAVDEWRPEKLVAIGDTDQGQQADGGTRHPCFGHPERQRAEGQRCCHRRGR